MAAYETTTQAVDETKQYVGIDLHRRRSVIVRQTAAGEVIEQVRIDNDALALAAEIAKAGPEPEVVLEATYGWYWAADVLAECGATVHLAHPLAATGASTKELMARMGHRSSRAALLYQHATRDRDAAIARALGELIERTKPAPAVPIGTGEDRH